MRIADHSIRAEQLCQCGIDPRVEVGTVGAATAGKRQPFAPKGGAFIARLEGRTAAELVGQARHLVGSAMFAPSVRRRQARCKFGTDREVGDGGLIGERITQCRAAIWIAAGGTSGIEACREFSAQALLAQRRKRRFRIGKIGLGDDALLDHGQLCRLLAQSQTLDTHVICTQRDDATFDLRHRPIERKIIVATAAVDGLKALAQVVGLMAQRICNEFSFSERVELCQYLHHRLLLCIALVANALPFVALAFEHLVDQGALFVP